MDNPIPTLTLLCLPLALLLLVGFNVLRVIAGSQAVVIPSTLIAPAAVTWLVPAYCGWIHVREGIHVGVISRQARYRSGLFFCSPFEPVSLNVVSIQRRPINLSVADAGCLAER